MAKSFANRLKDKKASALTKLVTLNDDDNQSTINDIIINAKEKNRLIDLPPSRFKPDPTQPRIKFDDQEINDLMQDMLVNSQMQPILVRAADEEGIYPIISGERRWRAIQLSKGLIPSVLAIKVSNDMALDELKILMMQLSENSKRQDITLFEEAQAFLRAIDLCKKQGLSQKEAAELLGISPTKLTKYLALTTAPEKLKQLNVIQDLESLYNLSKAAKTDPEKTEKIIEAIEKGEIKSEEFRKTIKSLLKKSTDQISNTPKIYVKKCLAETIHFDASKQELSITINKHTTILTLTSNQLEQLRIELKV